MEVKFGCRLLCALGRAPGPILKRVQRARAKGYGDLVVRQHRLPVRRGRLKWSAGHNEFHLCSPSLPGWGRLFSTTPSPHGHGRGRTGSEETKEVLEPSGFAFLSPGDRRDAIERVFSAHTESEVQEHERSAVLSKLCRTVCASNDQDSVDLFVALLEDAGLDLSRLDDEAKYAAMLAFAKVGDAQKAVYIFRLLSKSSAIEPLDVHHALVLAMTRSGNLDQALQLLGKLRAKRKVPQRRSYEAVLEGAMESSFDNKRHVSNIAHTIRTMWKHGYAVSPDIYEEALQRCMDVDAPMHLHNIYRDMRAHGMMPNIYTCNEMLWAYASRGDAWAEHAIDLFEDMARGGPATKPTIFSYCVVIHVAGWLNAGGKRRMEAWKVFCRMRNNGITPTLHAYRVLLNATSWANAIRLSMQILTEEMRRDGIVPDENCCYNVLSACARNGKIPKVIEVLNFMKKSAIPTGFQDYFCLVRAAVSNGKLELAFKFVEEILVSADSSCQILAEDVSVMLCYLARTCKDQSSLRICIDNVIQLKRRGLELDWRVYATLTNACMELDAMKEENIVREMAHEDGIVLDDRDIDEALELQRRQQAERARQRRSPPKPTQHEPTDTNAGSATTPYSRYREPQRRGLGVGFGWT